MKILLLSVLAVAMIGIMIPFVEGTHITYDQSKDELAHTFYEGLKNFQPKQAPPPEYVFNDSYIREDYRFMIKHYDWEIYDSTDKTYGEHTKNFGYMESLVAIGNTNASGIVEIFFEVDNSQTMINEIPHEKLKSMMMEEAKNFCHLHYVPYHATCVEVTDMNSKEKSMMIGPEYEQTQTQDFLFNFRLDYESTGEVDLWHWYRLWNDPYDGKLMLAEGRTLCDPTIIEQFEEFSCIQNPSNPYTFEPETLHILGSLHTLPIKYNNEQYGFTFTYPQGTASQYFDDVVIPHPQLSTLGLEAVALYTYEDSNATILPHMKIFAMDLETEFSDLPPQFDESYAQEMTRGFLDGLVTQGMEGELLSSNMDKITDGIHMEFKSKVEFDIGLPETIPAQMDANAWMLKDGVIIYYIYVAETSDYNRYLSEYKNSVNSFAFEPRVVNQSLQPTQVEGSEGGGCLIATAAFGSEMAPQVQFLRELRDNTVMNTQSGTAFMTGFNQFYYSFSPYVADYERENPVFKEAVKVTLTPLLTSLTLLNYVEVDTEEEMLGYGISIILLNVGMYFVAPAAAIIVIKNRIKQQ